MARHDFGNYDLANDTFTCVDCGHVVSHHEIGVARQEWCPGLPTKAPITDIASARVAKARYAKDITPIDCLRSTLAELEAGLPCTTIAIVLGAEVNGGERVATTLRLGGPASYYERVGLLQSGMDTLSRDAGR